MEENNTREKLAELSHNQWAGWMKYMFALCFKEEELSTENQLYSTGRLIIPEALVARWTRQMNTPYHELPESEKPRDRLEADKILKITGDKYEQLKVVVQDLLTEIGIVPSDVRSIAKLADYESTHIGAKIKVSTAQKLLDAGVLDK